MSHLLDEVDESDRNGTNDKITSKNIIEINRHQESKQQESFDTSQNKYYTFR